MIANFIGRSWTVLALMLCVPFYVKLLGVEAYGLVGFYASMLAVMGISDIGLTPTLKRELARLMAIPNSAEELRDTTRTIEWLQWGLMAVIVGVVYVFAPFIGEHWLQSKSLDSAVIVSAIRWMGLALVLQLVFNLYQGGLIGLQQQVKLNVIQVVGGFFQYAGIIPILIWIAPTIKVYLLWQVLANGLEVVWSRYWVWRSLPHGNTPRFRWPLLLTVWRYAAGMLGMTVTATILTQADKIVLSRLLPLEVFGYYSLAWSVAQTPVATLTTPVQQAFFPRLTAEAAAGASAKVSALYHQAGQLIAVLVWPVALVIGFFAPEVLRVWLGNSEAATNATPLLRVLIVGSGLQGILVLPFAAQQAYGWPGLGLWINSVSAVIIVPGMYWLVGVYGAVGAAIAWLLINTFGGTVSVWVMHNRILIGERWQWTFRDVALPLLAAILPVVVGRFILPARLGRFETLIMLGLIWAATASITVLAIGPVRKPLVTWFRRSFGNWHGIKSQ